MISHTMDGEVAAKSTKGTVDRYQLMHTKTSTPGFEHYGMCCFCSLQAQAVAMGEERGRRQQRLSAAEREEAQLFVTVLAAGR